MRFSISKSANFLFKNFNQSCNRSISHLNIIWDIILSEILHEADPTDETDPPQLPRLEEQVQ
jgi:hypothetical protein